MSILRRAIPAAISLLIVAAITAVLWYLELSTTISPHDPVFFYVLPLTLVAIVYGSGPALLGAVAAFVCADYFLYEPFYSFDITTRVEFGDLTCFSLLAIIGIKCAVELFRPERKMRIRKSVRSALNFGWPLD